MTPFVKRDTACGRFTSVPDGHALDQCLRKVAYPTWKEANANAVQLHERHPENGLCHAYVCHFNRKHWHIGRPSTAKFYAGERA